MLPEGAAGLIDRKRTFPTLKDGRVAELDTFPLSRRRLRLRGRVATVTRKVQTTMSSATRRLCTRRDPMRSLTAVERLLQQWRPAPSRPPQKLNARGQLNPRYLHLGRARLVRPCMRPTSNMRANCSLRAPDGVGRAFGQHRSTARDPRRRRGTWVSLFRNRARAPTSCG